MSDWNSALLCSIGMFAPLVDAENLTKSSVIPLIDTPALLAVERRNSICDAAVAVSL